jgi:hypothetical protein
MTTTEYIWVPMESQHVAAAFNLAADFHPNGFNERLEVFYDKFQSYPIGCYVLVPKTSLSTDIDQVEVMGYAISYPWYFLKSPPIDDKFPEPILLLSPTESTVTYFIHDVLITTALRQHHDHYGRQVVEMIESHAIHCRYSKIALIAMANSQSYWEKVHPYSPWHFVSASLDASIRIKADLPT